LLLYSKLAPGPEEALAALREAVVSGRLSEARIAESLERLRRLRAGSAARPGNWSPELERQARDLIPGEELARICEGSIRLNKQGAGGIPLRTPIEVLEINRPEGREPLAQLLRVLGADAREHEPTPATWPPRVNGSAVMTVAARADLSEAETAIAQAWLRRFPETVTIALLNPHVCDEWADVRTLLVTFGNSPAARRALARRLLGRVTAV
ncbi:MAG TPA: hypothetical protein VFU59_07790, partial [Candidatus Eisenbacteria bacterium]|nr:hypothetical protein [Candidatus Eisenbacteria bacterium]